MEDVRETTVEFLAEHPELEDEFREAGTYAVRFTAADLPSGVYIARLRAGDRVLTRTMTLLR